MASEQKTDISDMSVNTLHQFCFNLKTNNENESQEPQR